MDREGTPAVRPHLDLLRAAYLCHPRWNEVGPLTFHWREDHAPVWEEWKETVWMPLLRPQLALALRAAARGDAGAVRECALALDAELPARPCGRSRMAGRRLAADYTAPWGVRFWKRLTTKFLTGEITPHLVLVMALRAQTFHLPPWQALRTYLLIEANGSGRLSAAQCGSLVADCEESGEESPLLQVA